MKLSIALTLTVLLVGFALAEDESMTLKTFDMGTLNAPRVPIYGPTLGLSNPHWNVEPPEIEPESFFSVDMMADYIRDTIDPDVWDMGADVMGYSDRLVARAPRSVLSKIESTLAEIESEASRRIHFEVKVLDLPATAYETYAGGTTGLKAGFPPGSLSESVSGEAYPGIATSLKITNRIRYVSDYDVEIAQGSMISDPIVQPADEGFVVDLTAHPTLDGSRILVETLLQRGRFLQPVETVTLGLDEEYFARPFRSDRRSHIGILQLPRFRHQEVYVTRLVASGQPFAVPVVEGDRLRLFVITPKLLGGDGSPKVLNVGAMSHRPVPRSFGYNPDMEEPWHSNSAPRILRGLREGRPLYGAEELMDLVTQNTSPEYWEEEGRVNVIGRRHMVISAEDIVLAGVRRFLAAREHEVLRTVLLDLRIHSTAGPVRTGVRESFNEPNTSLVYGGTIATLPARTTCLMSGNTRNYLADYDVEVAQEARIADPIIGQSFEGLVANLTPYLTSDRRKVRLDVQLLLSRRKSDEEFDSDTQHLGPIHAIQENRTVVNTTVEIPSGQTYVLDLGPDPSYAGRRLAATIGTRVE